MSNLANARAHAVIGGYPPGTLAAHDMDYARMRLLGMLHEHGNVTTTVAGDFSDIDKWLPGCQLLVTYVAGPYPDDTQTALIEEWLGNGGHWLALHGTSGGKAARVPDSRRRAMVKLAHHAALGCFFLNHPPIRRFKVDAASHALTQDVPAAFEVDDEMYLVEMQEGDVEVLLTTEFDVDPSPAGFGFAYDADTSAQADGRTRVLGYLRRVGSGGVVYYALGHCHSPASNGQPFVDSSVVTDGVTPLNFRGSWELAPFEQLLKNAIAWGVAA